MIVIDYNVVGEFSSIHSGLLAFPSGEDVDPLIETEGLVALPLQLGKLFLLFSTRIL